MRHELRLFLLALQFLTRVPVPAWVGCEPAWLNHCVRHFPLVGLCVGGFGALVLVLALALFPPAVAVLLSMIATVWLTGAFHEDGLADTCDALGGTVSRERAFEIMKDSRIGTYGACGLILALGLKAAVLTELVLLHPVLACVALAWGHAASRVAPVWLMWMLPYGGDAEHAKAKPLATQVGAADVVIATIWLALLCAVVWGGAVQLSDVAAVDGESGINGWGGADGVAGLHGIADAIRGASIAEGAALMQTAAVMMAGLCTWPAARWLRKRLGGYTGDTLGALQQVTEIAVLLAWLAVASAAWAPVASPG